MVAAAAWEVVAVACVAAADVVAAAAGVAVATEEAAINLKVTEARTVAAGVEVNNKVVMAAETLVEAMVLHRLPVAGIKEANKAVGAVGLIKAPGAALILVDNPLDNKAAGEALKVDMAAAPADMVAAAATVMAKVVALWEVAMNNRVMAEVP